MRLIAKALVVGSLLVLPLAFVTPLVALAHAEDEPTVTNTEDKSTVREQAKERAKAKLDATKLRVCENRAKNIEAIMTRSIKRAEHQGKLFTTIAERVKAFYVEKGKTVANYDELVAAVDSAKTTLDTHLAALKEVEFACDSDDPKGSIDSFKEAHQQVLTDLKALRTAVKNLIVGVRSAQGSDS